jgi:putative restriction endonuclease
LVPTVRDYLALSPPAAREQWRSIETRVPVTSGRQVDFVPVETLLCLAASLLVDHRRYGGSTSHRAAEPVPTLAHLFRRPNSSVLAKMANLDGSRRNGAKYEVEVAGQLLASPGHLAAIYRVVLAAARSEGLAESRLPDFLGLEDENDDLVLVGQEELDQRDVEAAVQKAVASWAARRLDLDERVTERLLVAAVRIGQHRFANDVLRNHGHRCVFCGLAVTTAGTRAARMLVASHIKPWRDCAAVERLDVQNGLAACPTHDAAFDVGLLTVNGGLRIHLELEVTERANADSAARAAFGRPPLADRLLLPAGAVRPGAAYLAWHHTHIYQGDPTVFSHASESS